MTDPKEVLEICGRATPGPWKVVEGKSFGVQSENKNIASCFRTENEQFIALARTAMPELAQRVIELEAENAALRAELNETYIDENGETWFRPTAEAYYAVCKARNKWQEQSEEWRADLKRYKLWVNDLQSGMYVNCVYCGHRYGPADKVPVSMADALKEHIEHCPEHPMSKIKAEAERLREEINDCYKTVEKNDNAGFAGLMRDVPLCLTIEEIFGDLREADAEVKRLQKLEMAAKFVYHKQCKPCIEKNCNICTICVFGGLKSALAKTGLEG